MASLSLTPAPGLYAQSSVNVTMSATGYNTILVSTAAQPALTKNIAYDSFGNPFITALQDGKGNVLFDGGFPKFYGVDWNPAVTTYAGLDNRHKFMANAMNWLAAGNAVGTPKRIMVYGDAIAGESHSVKGTADYDFNVSLKGIAAIAGYDLVFYDRADYNASTPIPYNIMSGFSSIIIFSTLTAADDVGSGQMAPQTLTNLSTFRQNGGGIMIVTGHDVFQTTANQVAALFSASFSGDVDREPVSVDYLVATYGNHPLWANMNGRVYAGASEGIINVPTNIPFNPATGSISVSGPGYRNIYVTTSDANGIVSTSVHSYTLQIADPISFTTPLPASTVFKYIDFPYSVDHMNSTDTSGFVGVNGGTIGAFTRTASGISKSYYNTTFKPLVLTLGTTNAVTVNVIQPINYSKTTTVQLAAIDTTSVVPAKRWSSMRVHEHAGLTTKAGILASFRANQGLAPSVVSSRVLSQLNQYYAATYTAPIERTIIVGSVGTVGNQKFGYDIRPATGTAYGSINSSAVLFGDRTLNHVANYESSGNWFTSVSFSRAGGASQALVDFSGKRLRVLNSIGDVLLDVAFTSATTSLDSGGMNGFVMVFPSARYIFAAGTQYRIQIV